MIEPIGTIITPFEDPSKTPWHPRMAAGVEGIVELLPQYAQGLKDLEGFERIWLLFCFHRSQGPQLLVRPPFDEQNLRGVFATRSPQRPNAIGMSCVRLIRVEGNMLCVHDVDMLNGTPLLDIKPYVPRADCFEATRIGWLEGKDTGETMTDTGDRG
jgi:tRNA (adenine37-N6)-methyltransferase